MRIFAAMPVEVGIWRIDGGVRRLGALPPLQLEKLLEEAIGKGLVATRAWVVSVAGHTLRVKRGSGLLVVDGQVGVTQRVRRRVEECEHRIWKHVMIRSPLRGEDFS